MRHTIDNRYIHSFFAMRSIHHTVNVFQSAQNKRAIFHEKTLYVMIFVTKYDQLFKTPWPNDANIGQYA